MAEIFGGLPNTDSARRLTSEPPPGVDLITSEDLPGQAPAMVRFIRSSPVGTVCLIFLIALVIAAIGADHIAPYDPLLAHYSVIRNPPDLTFLFGTDHLGRDVLSRIIYGARVTLSVAVTAAVIGDSIGFLWGMLSAYYGGYLDLLSQRVLDVLMAFPALILALLLLAGLGAGVATVIIAITVTRVPFATRITRSIVLSVRQLAYVEGARALGAPSWRIMVRHIAPQCVAALLVVLSLDLGASIFAESALSFLGVGIPPPTPTWGNMLGGILAEAFEPPWWLVLFPGLCITLSIMATNLLGDTLRDFLDPRLKRQF